MFNKVILIGRLGRDPELRVSQSGSSFANFTLATNDGFGDNKRTDWHNVTAFGKTAESICKFLKKGSICALEGRIQYDSYEKDGVKKNTTKILADHVTFLSSKNEDQSHGKFEQQTEAWSDDTFEGKPLTSPQAPAAAAPFPADDFLEDVPF